MPNKFRLTILGISLLGLKAILTVIGFVLISTNPAVQISDPRIGETGKKSLSAEPERATQTDFGKVPLSFEANQGQTDGQVKFLSRGNGYTLFLTGNEAVLALKKGQSEARAAAQQQATVLRISLDKANPAPEVTAQNELPGRSNYFSGNDAQSWRTDVQTFARVHYKDVYPGVDQIFYGNGRQLEYDFIVAPHRDAKQIALNFEGVEKIKLDDSGELILQLKDGEVRQHKPFIYQEADGERKEIAGNYVLKNETQVGFEIGEYDASKSLVIDPVLVYSTYLGGTGYDSGDDIAVDNAGNAYIVGSASLVNFPTTPGAYQTVPPGTFVAKLNPAGTALVYSTYLTGGGGVAIEVDAAGNAYVAGSASSPSFPITPGAFQTSPGGFDVSLTKLNVAGNALIYSSRFGGDYDDFVRDIALDAAGNAYLAGWTKNPTPISTFPVVNAFQPNYGGGNNDGFVTKVNATGTALVYSTYLGAGEVLNTTDDWAEGIAVDSAGSAYVTGYTYSPDFPVTQGAYDRERCGLDAFVTKFAPDGRTLVYSTFFGGCAREQGMGIAVDGAGNAFVAGITESNDMPTTAGAFQRTGSFDAFVMKLNPAGSALVYSTYLGGDDVDRGWGLAIDNSGNAVVTGDTKSRDFPITNALYPTYRGGASDAFVTKLNPTGTALVFSTYLGGSLTDEGRGIATQGNGNVFVTGNTSAYNFPTTAGAFQTQNAGGNDSHDDAFVVKLSDPSAVVRRTPFDFDGDSRADVSVFRPSTGFWYMAQSTAGFRAAQFGTGGDSIAPGDYDGDGKADTAVFRSSTGYWYILNSSNNALRAAQFGQSGDLPSAADYDGDSKADISVYRPATGTFYHLNSSNNSFHFRQWGQSGDVPVLGDYDGDNKTDYGVFRPSVGTFYLLLSSDGSVRGQQFGTSGDKPVAGDFDADGKTDVAVYRPSSGGWYMLNTSDNSVRGLTWGTGGDIPSAGDYDGDGKCDVAVFRPATGTFYILQSTNNALRAEQFGTNGDVPIPSAYVP